VNIQVLIESQAGSKRTIQMRANGPITIGRDADCGLRIKSDLISRRHAVVEFSPTAMRVEDRSTNGTLAGDQLLRRTSAWVSFGTPVVIGDHTLYFTSAAQPAEPATVETAAAGNPYPSHPHHPAPAPPPQPVHGSRPQTAPPPMAQAHAHVQPPPVPPLPATMPLHGMRGAVPGPMPAQQPYPQQPAQAPQAYRAPAPATAPAAQPELPVTGKRIRPGEADNELRREIHKQLLEQLDLASMKASQLDDPSMRPKVIAGLRRILELMGARIPPAVDRDRLVGELTDEALALGPLERLLADPHISEVMVVDADTIYIERNGRLELSDARFTDDERVRAVIERIVTPLGRRIDESSPLVDARLKDGSRVNAVIKPLALRGSCITIRKFAKIPLSLDKLVGFGALSDQMGRFLTRSVMARKNIIISGGTGSGKTTLLNVLSGAIPSDERIVTIEDAAELQLKQPHVVSLETRPANMEGKGEYTIRDLLKNAMRMRPDRVVVGECRGGEALDMLQAMNTGHDGSLTTTHANSPSEALKRIETLCLMAGVDLPSRAIREQIASSIHLVVQQSRFSDGTRKVSAISEVAGLDEELNFELVPIFNFVRKGTGAKGEVVGSFLATGYLPSFLNEFIVKGLVPKTGPFL
jgi:pilus assembly protein CpaF